MKPKPWFVASEVFGILSLEWHLQMEAQVAWGHVARGDPEHYLMPRGSFFLLFIFLRFSLGLFLVVLCWSLLQVALCSAGCHSRLWQCWWGWCVAAEPHWQKVGNLLRACLEVFFPFGSKTKQPDKSITLLNVIAGPSTSLLAMRIRPLSWMFLLP